MVNIFDSDDEKKNDDESRRLTAVALKKYGISDGAIPKIVAAGYGKLAEQILEIAFKNGVKVREDKELAQILAAITLESAIPSEALVAVAEILAYVYKANRNFHPNGEETSGGTTDDGPKA